jgi:hypothetical protein
MENSRKTDKHDVPTFRRVSVIVALVLFTLATNVFLTRGGTGVHHAAGGGL